MPTSGPLDPEFGQRSAFPIGSDITIPEGEPTNGLEYVLKVRKEAEDMARKIITQDVEPPSKRPMRRHNLPTQKLEYDEKSNFIVYEYMKSTFGIESPRSFFDFVAEAREAVKTRAVDANNCNSQATWKEFIMENEPIMMDHSTNLRIIKYLARWGQHQWTLSMSKWAWIAVLRLPELLTADETALLRDLVRAGQLAKDEEELQFLNAVARVAVDNYGQADLRQ